MIPAGPRCMGAMPWDMELLESHEKGGDRGSLRTLEASSVDTDRLSQTKASRRDEEQ